MCRKGVESSFQMFVLQFISVKKGEQIFDKAVEQLRVYGSAR